MASFWHVVTRGHAVEPERGWATVGEIGAKPKARMATTTETAVRVARLLPTDLSGRETLAEYQARGGYADETWTRTGVELIDAVEASGLRGRGGSGFPAGRKWRSVAGQPGGRVVLINAAESEPASRKDRTLLILRPHLVLEGALLAARAVGADEVVLYAHDDAADALASVEAAWHELKTLRWRLPRWRIVTAAHGYVAGEESAAIQRCNGKAAKPTFKPPLAYQRGIRNRPTLVQNVETLANIPLIGARGADWFRTVGTPEFPGTVLVTLSGAVRRPGVYEVGSGTPLGDVLEELGGGTPGGAGIRAVLVGGYFAGWLPGTAVDRVQLEPASLARHGVALGSAAIVVVPDTVCGLTQAVRLLQFFADESARQCGPCTFGTQAMADALGRIARGRLEPNDLVRLRTWAERTLPRRGACGHLDGATIAATTALRVFADEIGTHTRRGTCGKPSTVVLPGLEEPSRREPS